MKVIKAVGFANGVHCPHAGQYLRKADFEAHRGRGFMTFTHDVRRAMRFNDVQDLMEFWRTQSRTVPLRPDGQPNRPLTALTIEIEEAP